MINNDNNDIIILFKEQYKKYKESNKKLMEMILNENPQYTWESHYHLIDDFWMTNWKDKICFNKLFNLDKTEYKGEEEKIIEFIKKNAKSNTIEKLNNEKIYYPISNKKIINPMQSFDLISDEAWNLFAQNTNSNYDGKVYILGGNKKILIKFDENNYSINYLTFKNMIAEFIVVFNPPENVYKKNILEDVARKDINEWMKEVEFKDKTEQFTVNKYKIPFDIKLRLNRTVNMSLEENAKEGSQFISLNETLSYGYWQLYNSNSNFINSDELTSFINDTANFQNIRYVQKYNETSNIIAVMRCLSTIVPLVEYFTSPIKELKIFSKFQSFSLLNLIRDYFINIYNNKEKTPYAPKDFIQNIQKKKINIKEEQDPYLFLETILGYINKKLNNLDNERNFNYNDIKDALSKELYNSEIINILNNNNSIVGQNFYGLILEVYDCDYCKIKNSESIKKTKIINIDLLSIIHYLKEISDSFISKDIDDLLEFYFLKNHFCKCENKKINNNPTVYEYCPKCEKIINSPLMYNRCSKCKNQKKLIKREILEYPPFLIIKLNLGEFKEKEGFISNIHTNYDINYDTIKEIKDYYSKKNKKYNDINNFEYNLISMIQYSNYERKIKFFSICKSFFGPINNKYWISFVSNSKPKGLKTYYNDISQPYILFYKLQKKNN